VFDPVFSLTEVLLLIGLAQCIAGVAFLLLRAPDRRQAAVPAFYYAALGGHIAGLYLGLLTLDRLGIAASIVALVLRAALPAASALLILQVARGAPPTRNMLLVLLAALPELGPALWSLHEPRLCLSATNCIETDAAYGLTHILCGGALLLWLQVWLGRSLAGQLIDQPQGRERYWLITALIGLLTLTLVIDLLVLTGALEAERGLIATTVIALTFVYLVLTLLFRLAPSAPAAMVAEPGPEADEASLPRRELDDDDRRVIARISDLLTLDKVHQDQSYDRGALARELGIPEHRLSILVKSGFGKSTRQLITDARLAEARQLLADTDLPISQVAFDSGFNSLASFNRVFKSETGVSPTDYRRTARESKA
jgi:AraC-like DNA-binding protein